MFKFDTKNHIAYNYRPWTKWGDQSDRRYDTLAELHALPEFNAFNRCKTAWLTTSEYIPVSLSKALENEMKAWEKSCINLMKPISSIDWVLDDTNAGCPNPFCRFQGLVINIIIDEDRVLGLKKVTMYGEKPGTLINYSFFIEEDKSNDIQVGLGHLCLEDNAGNKAWLKFAR